MNQTPNAILCPHCQQPNSMRHTHCWSCTKPLAGGPLVYLSGPINPAHGIMVNGQLWQTGGPPQPAQAPPPPIINAQVRQGWPLRGAWLAMIAVVVAALLWYIAPIAMGFREEMEARGRIAANINRMGDEEERKAKEAEQAKNAGPKIITGRGLSRDQVARASMPGRTMEQVIGAIGEPTSQQFTGGADGSVDILGYSTESGTVYVFFSENGLVTGWSDDPMAYR